MRRLMICSVACAVVIPDIATAQVVVPDVVTSIEPSDCYALVARVHGEIELIRAEMGKPKVVGHAFDIEDAQPREVYFQALTLLKKTNRLYTQIARKTITDAHVVLTGVIQPRDVYGIVDTALGRIQAVKGKLGIPEHHVPTDREDTKRPTDVFHSIVHANRQLNLLLDQRFSPSDSFQQVTLALHHATQLRAHFPGRRIPETPPFDRGKIPADVHHKLVQCYERIRRIAIRSDIKMAYLRIAEHDDQRTTPSDVYDLASLVVAELAHLHERLTGEEPDDDSYPPGRKLPSHVYQRARLLEAQLVAIEKWVEQNPSWLHKVDNKR